jgi:copper chaperone
MLQSISVLVTGDQRMACEGCENRVIRLLRALGGVTRVKARASDQRIDVQFDPEVATPTIIRERLLHAGYETAPADAS